MNPELVQRMVMAPNHCMGCGCGNVEGPDGEIGPFIQLGIDYNWGDSGYMCLDCGAKIAALCGWMTPEEKVSLEATIEKRDRLIHNLQAKLEIVGRQKQELQNRVQKISDGMAEVRRVRREKVKS